MAKDQTKKQRAAEQLYQMSALVSRAMLADRLGQQFNGKRDLYDVFGYLKEPRFENYLALYERQGMATRIVDSFPAETWRKPPVLLDSKGRSDTPGNQTPFLKAWNELVNRHSVYQMLRRLDILCGIGRYAILFLGIAGSTEFSKPLTDQAGLAYLSVFDEGAASIKTYDRTKTSPRYGLPETYNIALGESGQKDIIHHSRTIHVAENKLRSRVFGRPRLQAVINRLFDIEKVVGGSAEAVWLSVYKGLAFMARDDNSLPEKGSPGYDDMVDSIEEYVHGLKRYMRLNGVDVKDLGSSVADPRGIYEVLISDIAGSLGTPKRLLIGSERGELSSSQDDADWAAVIEDRQKNFAEPDILRPFIDRCIVHGILPAPAGGGYSVEWPSLFQLTELDKAEVAVKVADAMSKASGGVPEEVMPVEVFAERYLGYVSEPGENADEEEQ